MKRTSTTTWSDCCVITRKCGELLDAMMQYQMHTYPPEIQGKGSLDGDMGVLVAARVLRNYLDRIIDKSSN